MADRRAVRAGDRSDQHPARTSLDAARDLLRLAAARPHGSSHRWSWLHPARPRSDPRAVRAVPRGITARLDTGCRDGSRRCRCCRRGQGRARRCRPNLETHHGRSAAPCPRLRARRGDRGGHDRPVARARPACVRRDRAELAAPARRRRCGLSRLAAARDDRGPRRDGRTHMDGAKGRGARVRRWVRDRSADAVRRRAAPTTG